MTGSAPPPKAAAERRQSHGIALARRVLAVITAALLAIDAYVHLRDASLYDAVTSPTLSQGALFRAEAVAAIVVAIALGSSGRTRWSGQPPCCSSPAPPGRC